MSNKRLVQAMEESRQALIKVLKDNPDTWKLDKSNPVNGNNQIRIFFEKRNDGNNPSQIVLEQPTFLDDCTPSEISFLLKQRVVDENRGITPSMNLLIDGIQSGKSELNADLLDAMIGYESTLNTYNNKVLKNHHLHWFGMEDEVLNNLMEKVGIHKDEDPKVTGALIHSVSRLKDRVITAATDVVFHYTNEDGTCPLHSSKGIVNNLFTQSRMENAINENENNEYFYRAVEAEINETLEREGRVERLSFPVLRELDNKADLKAAHEMSEHDPLIEEVIKMFDEVPAEPKQEQKEESKRKSKFRPK